MHRLVTAMQEALAAPEGLPDAIVFRDYLLVAVAVATALQAVTQSKGDAIGPQSGSAQERMGDHLRRI